MNSDQKLRDRYRAEMDSAEFSGDFGARTVRRALEAERPGRRRPLRYAIPAVAVCAAALVLTLLVGSPMDAFRRAGELATQSPPALGKTEATSAPVATATPFFAPNPQAPLATQVPAIQLAEAEYAMEYGLGLMDGGGAMESFSYAPSEPQRARRFAYEPQDTSEYARIVENRFLPVLGGQPSTFAASVDKASFVNVRGMIERGDPVPPDAVRIEEFVNYFHYDYPPPKEGEPFSVSAELAPCPWNGETTLLMVGLATAPIDLSEIPRSNLVFLIDVSGSMAPEDRLPLAQKAFAMLTEQLREGDVVSIVTYASGDRVALDGASGGDKFAILKAIDSLQAGGSTAGARGIETAYELARKHFIEGGNNRVILATDGDLNVGVTSEGALSRLIEEKKESGVYLSVMGFGYGNYKDDKLEALALHGKGNYNYINDAFDAKRVFVEELGATLFTACKDAKLQVEFNPEKIAEYRLIGYEARVMDAADFANDHKDGGQIGAGHQVTALYELRMADGAASEAGTRYQSYAPTGSDEFLTVSVRAKEPGGDVSREYVYPFGAEALASEPSENLRIAAAAAEFGMILRESEYMGSSTFASAAELFKGIDVTGDPYKNDFSHMLRKLAR